MDSEPGELQSMGSEKDRHDLATKQQQQSGFLGGLGKCT